MRSVAIIAASLIGLSTVGAFASGVYRHGPAIAGVAIGGTAGVGTSAVRIDSTFPSGESAVGSYCPIPARGSADKVHARATAARPAADSLLLTGQTVAPDTAGAFCTGTAAPAKRP